MRFELLEGRRLLSIAAELVTDINAAETTSDSSPIDFFPIGNLVFFTAGDEIHGRELWRTDGTEEGTIRLTETVLSVSRPFIHVVDVGGIAYFGANSSDYGRELWRSDGTLKGTVLVKDLLPGPEGAESGALGAVDGRVAFVGNDGVHGREIWISDGTAAGTKLLADINSGTANSNIEEAFEFQDLLLFRANDGAHGKELWVTDGTSEGTRLLKDIVVGPDSINPTLQLTPVGENLFFSAAGTEGFELWKTDGTPEGTQLVKDIRPGPSGVSPGDFAVVGDVLYFSADDGEHGRELWRSDGTEAGTFLVRDIRPNDNPLNISSSPQELTNVDDIVFFRADDGEHGKELWKTDGTEEGTVLVRDINPGADKSLPTLFTVFGQKLIFVADDGVHGKELWTSDGNEVGTELIKDILIDSPHSSVSNVTVAGDLLFFVGVDQGHGGELWISDGTSEGTRLAKDIRLGNASSSIREIMPMMNGRVVFSADDGLHGKETWISDGTESGTQLFDINRATDHSLPGQFTNLGDTVYFTASNGVEGTELWKTDGTEQGTEQVADIWTGPGDSRPTDLTPFDGKLFFAAENEEHGRELWRTDGTTEGTQIVKDINPGSDDAISDRLFAEYVSLDGRLYFVADDALHGRELWRTDGTANGTALVRDILPGSDSALPAELVEMNGLLFFRAMDIDGRMKLWRSDGTSEGTVPVFDVGFADDSRERIFPTPVDRTLFFRARDEAHGVELWKTDGTSEGTELVKDIRPVPDPYFPELHGSFPYGLTNVDGTLFFAADDGVHRKELWKSDGTESGTVMLRDINPSAAQCHYTDISPLTSCFEPIKYLTNVAGTLFFSADDGVHGRELWRSDGTPEGTVMVKDIGQVTNNRNRQSLPRRFRVVNDILLFGATDAVHGGNLWRSDGTEAGTFMIPFATGSAGVGVAVNLHPGSRPDPQKAVTRDAILFLARDDAHGVELWRIPLTPGDTNLDFVVDQTDLDNVRNHFGQTGDNLPGDNNGDRIIDIDDLNNVRNHFGAGGAGLRVSARAVDVLLDEPDAQRLSLLPFTLRASTHSRLFAHFRSARGHVMQRGEATAEGEPSISEDAQFGSTGPDTPRLEHRQSF